MGTGLLFTLCLAGLPLVVPATLWSAWSLAPAIAVPLLVAAILYASGAVQASPRPPRWRLIAFGAGWLLLAVALVSPLCRMAATLTSAHMVQHLILVAAAPPLLLLGEPARMFARAVPPRLTLGVARLGRMVAPLSRTLPATAVYGAAIWFWHIPAFYEAALTSAAAHLVMVASLLAASLVFWRVMLRAASGATALGSAAAAAVATLIHTGVLGAFLTFAPAPWYPLLVPGAVAWGLGPLTDQQLAGLIMWIPMGTLFLAAALLVFAVWLAQLAREPRPTPASLTE